MNGVAGIVNKTTLGALLAIQLVVIGVLLAARSGGIEEPPVFLSFDADAIDGLSVSNSEGSVELSKVDGMWQLPDGVPAAGFKIESVLERMSNAAGGWPVANTGSSRARFEVTEQSHQRHITVRAGEETVADIFLGTSPGYRKTHARRAGDDDLYAIKFSNYEAGVKTSDWLDRSLLRPDGDLSAMRRLAVDHGPTSEPSGTASAADAGDDIEPRSGTDGFELSKEEEGGWVSADGMELDQGKVETFAGRFKGLSAVDVSDVALPESATMTFVLTDDEGELTLSVFSLEEGEKYVAVSDRVAGAYELSKYIAEQMNKTLADFVPDPPEDEADEASEEAEIAEDAADASAVEELAVETTDASVEESANAGIEPDDGEGAAAEEG